MNCSRCGANIPDGVGSCPKCGFTFEESFQAPRTFPDANNQVKSPQAGGAASSQSGDPFEFPKVVHEGKEGLGAEPPRIRPSDRAQQGKERPPSSSPRGEQYVAPGDACTPGGYARAQPTAETVRATHAAETRGSRWPAVTGIVVLIVLVVLAAAYFLVWNKDNETTGPELTVQKYFDALSSGDAELLKAVYAPEAVPSDEALALVSSLYSGGIIKYEDIKLETVNETSTDAEVRVLDGNLTVTIADETVSTKLSDLMPDVNMVFKLKNVDGTWFISEGGELPTNIDIQPPGCVSPG